MNSETELVTLTQIAIRAGVSASAVSNWRKRYSDFPQPVDGDRFATQQVNEWLRSRGKSAPEPDAGTGLLSISQAVNMATHSYELSRVQARPAIATLVTLVALDADLAGDAPDFTAIATQVEADRQLPPGCLTGPVEPLRRVHSPNSDLIASSVIRAVANWSAAKVFDSLLAEMADRDAASSESLTNTSAIDFLTALLPDRAGSVLDPACGTGGLLQAAAATTGATHVSGYDINSQAWALCVQRLLLHGLPIDQVHHQDVFAAQPTGFDLVITHPPFGLRTTPDSPAGQLLLAAGLPASAGDLAWLLTARNALADGGTAVVLTTAGPAFQRAGAGLRHELVRTGSVKAVISLPGAALKLPGTTVGTMAWILGSPTTDVRPVLMVNGAAADTLEEIIEAVTTWRDHPARFQPVPGFTATLPVLELLAADVDLNPALATAVPIDPDQALHTAATTLDTLTAATRALANCPPAPNLHLQPGDTPLVNLTDLAEVTRPPHLRRDQISDHGPHPYATGVTGDALRIAGQLTDLPDAAVVTEPGDVVLSTTGRISAVVDHTGGHVLGSSVWRIRPTSELAAHPDVLALLLNSSRISAQTSGTTVQRLRHPKDITIACPDPDTIAALQQWLDTTSHTRYQANSYLTAANAAEQAVTDALDAGATAIPTGEAQ